MKTAASIEAFWRAYPTKAEEGFQIAERIGSLDVQSRRAQGICLNSAEHIEDVAFELVLAGFDERARRVFTAIPSLALASIEGQEKGHYSEVIFARYMAMREASTAEWMLNGTKRDEYFEKMLAYLHESIRGEAEKAKREVRDVPQVGGRLALHYAQVGRWTDITAMPELMRVGGGTVPLWRSLFKVLRVLAAAKVGPGDARALRRAFRSLEEWFVENTSVKRFGQPWHPGLTSNDIVSVAEVRARWVYSVTDPWRTVRSIRWPNFSEQP